MQLGAMQNRAAKQCARAFARAARLRWLRVAGSSSPAAAAGPRTIDRMSSSVDVGIASDNVANFNGSGPGSSAATNSTEDTATVVRHLQSPGRVGCCTACSAAAPRQLPAARRTHAAYAARSQGKHLSSTLINITPERVAEYIARTGDDHPWYTSDSPFGGSVAPAHLFPSHSSGGGWFLPNMHGNLHARQEWEFYGPMRVGTQVLATRTIVDRYTKRGRIYVVCEVNMTDAKTGQLLSRNRHHQSFLEDQSDEAIEAWQNGTSAARIAAMAGESAEKGGQVISKERTRMPAPNEVGEVLETFGPVSRDATLEFTERFAGTKAGETFGNGHLDPKEAEDMGKKPHSPNAFCSSAYTSSASAKLLVRARVGIEINLWLCSPTQVSPESWLWACYRSASYQN